MTTLMIQGTTSDAGKSTLVAALCRCLLRRGYKVAPFKPQNMALNSAVTEDGGEIGRAQALQAQAAGIPPITDMNPVLLKPETEIGAQVIIHGKARGNMSATSYHEYKTTAMQAVLESHGRLEEKFEHVIVEGAGSPAEINLRDRDIANMGFAEQVDCPVILIADIDRGGVFAHLVGTLELLSQSEKDRVIGFVINRFRGDISLLQSGLDWLETFTGKPVFGVLPYLHDLYLDAEDALPEQETDSDNRLFRVIVPVIPHISNHTDFDPLRLHPEIDFRYVRIGESIPAADLIILPGSKSVRADLTFLKENGWDREIKRHLRYGGKVLGICGGYQMLGKHVIDDLGVEGKPGQTEGFRLLDCETTLTSSKLLKNCTGYFSDVSSPVEGYEIHTGVTSGPDIERPVIINAKSLNSSDESLFTDGATSQDDCVKGTYWHGLFDKAEALDALIKWAGFETKDSIELDDIRESQLNRLADTLESSVAIEKLITVLEENK